MKLAALEAQFFSEVGAPLRIGGWPDIDARRVRAAIEIPHGLSFLAFGDWGARVRGLDEFPRDEWPPVARVHVAFQVMVVTGTTLAALGLLAAALALRRRGLPDAPTFLVALVVATPLGFVALEAGWLVTEWGRQPWIVRDLLRTADAVTSAPHRAWPFWTFTLVYLFLGITVAYLLTKQIGVAHQAVLASSDPSSPDPPPVTQDSHAVL